MKRHKFCAAKRLSGRQVRSRFSMLGVGAILFVVAGCSKTEPGFITPVSTSDQLSTAEVEAIVDILRNDGEARDTFLNSEPATGSARRIPRELMEAVVGKPNARATLGDGPRWTYRTRDGVVTLQVWLSEPEEVPSADTIKSLMIHEVSLPIASRPNEEFDRIALREKVLAAKQEFDVASAEKKRKLTDRRLAEAQAREKAELAATVKLERAETERLQSELKAAAAMKDEREKAAVAIMAEQTARRELEVKAAQVAAQTAFASIAQGPHIQFSRELGIEVAPVVEFNVVAQELVAAVKQGVGAGDWLPLMRHLNVTVQTHLTREDIRKALAELEVRRDDNYRFIVRAPRDLSEAAGYRRFEMGIGVQYSPQAHPDGNAWVFAWAPLAREVFLFDGRRVPIGDDAFSRYQDFPIDEAVRHAKSRSELDGSTFDADAIRRQATLERYAALQSSWLSDTVSGPSIIVATGDDAKRPVLTKPKEGRMSQADEGAPKSNLPAKLVTLTTPYPAAYPGAATDKISLQYAVMALAKQAGITYDFETSQKNTDPICREWVTPNIRGMKFEVALLQLLNSKNLAYSYIDNKLVLCRK